MSLEIPKDFEGKIIDKKEMGDLKDTIVIIYFDEDKWHPTEICHWLQTISEYFGNPVLMLPKSFSQLEKLNKSQLELLIKLSQDALNKLDK